MIPNFLGQMLGQPLQAAHGSYHPSLAPTEIEPMQPNPTSNRSHNAPSPSPAPDTRERHSPLTDVLGYSATAHLAPPHFDSPIRQYWYNKVLDIVRDDSNVTVCNDIKQIRSTASSLHPAPTFTGGRRLLSEIERIPDYTISSAAIVCKSLSSPLSLSISLRWSLWRLPSARVVLA